MNAFDLRHAILASSRAGARLAEIERELIDPAALAEDEKAAMWLLAWCSVSADDTDDERPWARA